MTLAASRVTLGLDAKTSAHDLMHTLMRFKAWSDAELMKAVLALPDLASTREGGYVATIVRHFHTVDRIFKAHLLGVPHEYTSVNPPEPATLAELSPGVAEIDAWYVDYTRDLAEQDQGEVLNVRFTDGNEQRLTRSEVLLHVALHGAYHRGNIGVLLRLGGAEPAPDGIPRFVRERGE